MGSKSRGSYKIKICLRFDCKKRDVACDICRLYSEYEKGDAKDENRLCSGELQ